MIDWDFFFVIQSCTIGTIFLKWLTSVLIDYTVILTVYMSVLFIPEKGGMIHY